MDNTPVTTPKPDPEFDVFTPVAQEFAEAPALETPAEDALVKVSREIDFGDGAGKRTIEADTADALIDLITAEQVKAAETIRTRAARKKPDETAPVVVPDPKELTADELFALSQELTKNPASAFDKIMQAQTGLTARELRDEVAGLRQQRLIAQADATFLSQHAEDFKPSRKNADAITAFLTQEKLAYTAGNLEYAFQELSEQGVLDKPATDKTEVAAHTRNKPMSSGLSRKSGTAPAVVALTGTKEELEVEKFRALSAEDRRSYLARLAYAAKK